MPVSFVVRDAVHISMHLFIGLKMAADGGVISVLRLMTHHRRTFATWTRKDYVGIGMNAQSYQKEL